jgi:hypothetical protein
MKHMMHASQNQQGSQHQHAMPFNLGPSSNTSGYMPDDDFEAEQVQFCPPDHIDYLQNTSNSYLCDSYGNSLDFYQDFVEEDSRLFHQHAQHATAYAMLPSAPHHPSQSMNYYMDDNGSVSTEGYSPDPQQVPSVHQYQHHHHRYETRQGKSAGGYHSSSSMQPRTPEERLQRLYDSLTDPIGKVRKKVSLV